MATATLERGQELGLVDDRGQLTPYGQVVERTVGNPNADAIRENFKRGFIDENLDLTRRGTIYTGTRENAIRGGPDDWMVWRETGAEDKWQQEADTGDPFLAQVGKAVSQMVTKTVPKAAAGSIFGVEMPLFTGQRKLERETGGDVFEILSGKDKKTREAIRTMIRGGLAKESFRGWEMIDVGLDYILTKKSKKSTEEDIARAQWNYERMMLMYDEMTAAEATEVADATMSRIFGGTREEQKQAAAEARERVAQAEASLTPEQAAGAVQMGAAGGDLGLGDPANLLTMGWASGVRTLAKGAMTSARAAEMMKSLAVKQARRQALQSSIRAGRITTPATTAALSRLDDEIAGLQGTLAKMEARSGAVGVLKDRARSGLAKLSESGLGRGVATVGKKLDSLAEEMAERTGKGMKVAAAAGAAGAVMGSPIGLPIALAAGAASYSNRIKAILRGGQIAGAEFLRRRGQIPYFQRLAERAKENPLFYRSLQGVDMATRPIKAAGKMGPAAARAISAEMPFSYVAAAGEDGWLADAVAEGIVFGSPGLVSGLAHGAGIPVMAQKAEMESRAMADKLEFRRVLTPEQLTEFDSLSPGLQRVVSDHAAFHPDLTYRFKRGSGGGSYDSETGIITIDPTSKHPLEVLVSHEALHHAAANGLLPAVYDKLLGPNKNDGYLFDKDGNLNKDAQAFKDEYERMMRGKLRADYQAAGINLSPEVLTTIDQRAVLTPERLAEEFWVVANTDQLVSDYHTGALQRAARRNPMARAVVAGLMDRNTFLSNSILRLSGMLNNRGRVVYGSGMESPAKVPEELRRLVRAYYNEAAGRRQGANSTEKREATVTAKTRDWQRPENYDFFKDHAGFEHDPETNLARTDSRGQLVPIDWETKKMREQIGARLAAFANSKGVASENGVFMLEKGEWAEFIQKEKERGVWNNLQLQFLEMIADSVTSDNPREFLTSYNKVYNTRKSGKKAVPKGGSATEIRPFGFYNYRVTKAGNITLFAFDRRQLERNLDAAIDTPQARELYASNRIAIMRDVQTMMENWRRMAEGKTDVDANKREFGEKKLRFLNALMGNVGSGQKDLNPLLSRRPFSARNNAVVKTTRLDRLNWIQPLDEPLLFDQKRAAAMQLPEPGESAPGLPEETADPETTPSPEPEPTPELPPSEPETVTIRRFNDRGRPVEAEMSPDEARAVLETDLENLDQLAKWLK